jgi:hypothetical protein
MERMNMGAADPAVAENPDANCVAPHPADPLKDFLVLSIDVGTHETHA